VGERAEAGLEEQRNPVPDFSLLGRAIPIEREQALRGDLSSASNPGSGLAPQHSRAKSGTINPAPVEAL
jgi:hypothetical protein